MGHESQTRLPWTAEEDAVLISLVERYGEKRWNMVANGLPGRTGKGCSHRWRTYLRPDVKHPHLEPFTEWEAAVIVQAQRDMGNNWLAIAKLLLPGRSNTAVKNFWHCRLKNGTGTHINRFIVQGLSLRHLLNEVPHAQRIHPVALPAFPSTAPTSQLHPSAVEAAALELSAVVAQHILQTPLEAHAPADAAAAPAAQAEAAADAEAAAAAAAAPADETAGSAAATAQGLGGGLAGFSQAASDASPPGWDHEWELQARASAYVHQQLALMGQPVLQQPHPKQPAAFGNKARSAYNNNHHQLGSMMQHSSEGKYYQQHAELPSGLGMSSAGSSSCRINNRAPLLPTASELAILEEAVRRSAMGGATESDAGAEPSLAMAFRIGSSHARDHAATLQGEAAAAASSMHAVECAQAGAGPGSDHQEDTGPYHRMRVPSNPDSVELTEVFNADGFRDLEDLFPRPSTASLGDFGAVMAGSRLSASSRELMHQRRSSWLAGCDAGCAGQAFPAQQGRQPTKPEQHPHSMPPMFASVLQALQPSHGASPGVHCQDAGESSGLSYEFADAVAHSRQESWRNLQSQQHDSAQTRAERRSLRMLLGLLGEPALAPSPADPPGWFGLPAEGQGTAKGAMPAAGTTCSRQVEGGGRCSQYLMSDCEFAGRRKRQRSSN